jgi:hypothetical protein
MYGLLQQVDATTHDLAQNTNDLTGITDELRDHIADFDDFYRPIRSYFYWEKHCFDIPVCWSLRSLFDALDGVDELTDKLHNVNQDTQTLDSLLPQTVALLPPMIDTLKTTRGLMLATLSTMSAIQNEQAANNDTAIVMGQSFDTAKNGDLFYLPPEAFQNPEFQRGLKMFLSPDGKSARAFITHQDDPMTPEGIARVGAERTAAQDGLKMSSLSSAKIYLGGTAATYADMADGAKYDLMIVVVSSLTLIFMIMLILTRSLVAASGGRIGLQPAAGLPDQGRDPRRTQDGDGSLHGRHRWRGDLCGPGIRRHHGLHAREQSAHHRSAGFHHRHRAAARHTGRAHAIDALDRHTAGTVVLVAASRLPPRRPWPAPATHPRHRRRHGRHRRPCFANAAVNVCTGKYRPCRTASDTHRPGERLAQ